MADRAVLVTGGTGFVGGAVATHLAAAGRRVIRTATGRPPSGDPVIWDGARSVLPDVAWDEIDAIVHAASPRNASEPGAAEAVRRIAVDATAAMLIAARRHRVRRFVLVSTGDVLGGAAAPALETSRDYQPSSPYGKAKADAEQLALAHAGPPHVAVLRLFHPYGPGGDRFLVNRVLRQVLTGEPVASSGIRLNPVWIDDMAAGLARAVASDAHGVFHLAGPDLVTFDAMVELMAELAGVVARIKRLTPGIERHAGDCSRAASEFGFRPLVGLRTGLGLMLGCGMGARA